MDGRSRTRKKKIEESFDEECKAIATDDERAVENEECLQDPDFEEETSLNERRYSDDITPINESALFDEDTIEEQTKETTEKYEDKDIVQDDDVDNKSDEYHSEDDATETYRKTTMNSNDIHELENHEDVLEESKQDNEDDSVEVETVIRPVSWKIAMFESFLKSSDTPTLTTIHDANITEEEDTIANEELNDEDEGENVEDEHNNAIQDTCTKEETEDAAEDIVNTKEDDTLHDDDNSLIDENAITEEIFTIEDETEDDNKINKSKRTYFNNVDDENYIDESLLKNEQVDEEETVNEETEIIGFRNDAEETIATGEEASIDDGDTNEGHIDETLLDTEQVEDEAPGEEETVTDETDTIIFRNNASYDEDDDTAIDEDALIDDGEPNEESIMLEDDDNNIPEFIRMVRSSSDSVLTTGSISDRISNLQQQTSEQHAPSQATLQRNKSALHSGQNSLGGSMTSLTSAPPTPTPASSLSTSDLSERPRVSHGKPNLAPKPPTLAPGAVVDTRPSPPPKKLIVNGKIASRTQSMRVPRSPPVSPPSPQGGMSRPMQLPPAPLNPPIGTKNPASHFGTLRAPRGLRPPGTCPPPPPGAPPPPPARHASLTAPPPPPHHRQHVSLC
ncbi:uncharacterized protein LOC126371705 isoform X2 [Pectinophora gossypiella]|uniref:uncharacterized protein LOC126371705 isoform X2 n=1 Tax=Pectinophora gossypiella TaxID=13191 RepID=UPI00214EB6A8|nr:uncharacterized protein LOC126371705 isoform X2 [Pectinophora gossypiella]